MSGVLVRGLTALVALAAIAWLLISFSNEQRLADVSATAAKPDPTKAEIDEGLRRLDEDYPLNPDLTRIESMRAALYVRDALLAGDHSFERAAAAMERVVEREPQNAEAWALLATFTEESDPERSAAARARLAELDPAGERIRQGAR